MEFVCSKSRGGLQITLGRLKAPNGEDQSSSEVTDSKQGHQEDHTAVVLLPGRHCGIPVITQADMFCAPLFTDRLEHLPLIAYPGCRCSVCALSQPEHTVPKAARQSLVAAVKCITRMASFSSQRPIDGRQNILIHFKGVVLD